MTCHTTPTQPSVSAPAASSPTATALEAHEPLVRSAPVTPAELEEVFVESAGWRRHLGWRIRGLVPDADAEIAAIVWEHLTGGEFDHARLYWATVTSLRRLKRRALRRREREHTVAIDDYRNEHGLAGVTADFADEVTDRVAAGQLVGRLPAPSPTARPWVERMCAVDTGEIAALSSSQRTAASRWASAARRRIAVAL